MAGYKKKTLKEIQSDIVSDYTTRIKKEIRQRPQAKNYHVPSRPQGHKSANRQSSERARYPRL